MAQFANITASYPIEEVPQVSLSALWLAGCSSRTLFLAIALGSIILRWLSREQPDSKPAPLTLHQETYSNAFNEGNTSEIDDIRAKLQGAWKLISYEVHLCGPVSITRYPLGKNAQGMIMYTNDGYMAVQIMAQNRPLFKGGNPHSGTKEENSTAAASYMTYSGTYCVGTGADEKPLLKHCLDFSLYPNWLGTNQLRICELENDELTLRPHGMPSWNVRYTKTI